MINTLGEGIELLKTVQAAIIVAYGTEAEVPARKAQTPRVTKSTTKKRTKRGNYGETRALVRTVMQQSSEPLSVREILQRMERKDWGANVKSPVDTVRMALHGLHKRGEVRKVGGDWELAPTEDTAAEAQVVNS